MVFNIANMDQTSESTKEFQRQKYDEIIEMLLSAGYFRARINTLSDFDKVVGGLCWCITSSGEDVDVDILFQENSTIGQKITLSEAIVQALRKMNCPAQIQPHQIQGGVGGSDFNAIYPVIVWLVKKFFERRELREQQLRNFSLLQFGKNYQLPTECDKFTVSDSLGEILLRNKAVRQYKRLASRNESEETKVHSCLMEYGELFGYGGRDGGSTAGGVSNALASDMVAIESEASGKMVIKLKVQDGMDDEGGAPSKGGSSASSNMSAFDKKLALAQKESAAEETMYAEASQKMQQDLMKDMTSGGTDDRVSGSLVNSMVNLGSDEINAASAAYSAEEAATKNIVTKSGAKMGPLALFKRQKQALLKEQQELELKSIEMEADEMELSSKLQLLEEERLNALSYCEQLNEMMQQQDALEKQAKGQKELIALRDLVGLNESYKSQEAAFKASCKAQMADLQGRIKELEEATNNGAEDEETKKLKEIEEMHGKVLDKYNRLRQMLGASNQEVATVSRSIDDIPTRTELIQYERRFVELYQQVGWQLHHCYIAFT